MEFLARAINLGKKFIEVAKSDLDFDPIRKTTKFSELIGQYLRGR
ncbi:MAG: hypothetical protein ACFFEN_11025 [Candidatus Thorarchaeota archaeon]